MKPADGRGGRPPGVAPRGAPLLASQRNKSRYGGRFGLSGLPARADHPRALDFFDWDYLGEVGFFHSMSREKTRLVDGTPGHPRRNTALGVYAYSESVNSVKNFALLDKNKALQVGKGVWTP